MFGAKRVRSKLPSIPVCRRFREGQMRANVRKVGEICLVELSGEIKTGPDSETLRRTVKEQLEAGERLFVLDMTDVPWLGSSGIGETVACRNRVVDCDGRIAVVLRGKSHDLFTKFELGKVLVICDDVEEALASFAKT